MPKAKRITALRSDSAAYQAEIITSCEDHGIQCAIGAELDPAVLTAIAAIPERDWKPYQNGSIAETIHSMDSTDKAPSVLSSSAGPIKALYLLTKKRASRIR